MRGLRNYPHFRNWGRNFTCRPEMLQAPDSLDGIAAAVRAASARGRGLRTVGSGYSYTRLVQTDEVMLSLDNFQGVESVDETSGVAVIRAGTRLDRLARDLAGRGWALENMGDIDRQTLAGALATGTHGTGIALGNMSTCIRGLELMTASGEPVTITPDSAPEEFRAAQVSLGLLGVATRVHFQLQPMYWLDVDRRRLSFDQVLRDLDANVRGHRNYEFFWFPNADLVYSKAMNPATVRQGGGRTLGRELSDLVNENLALWLVCQINHHWPASRGRLLDIGSGLVPQGHSVQRADVVYATARLVVHQEMEYAVPYPRAAAVLGQLAAMCRQTRVRTMFPIEVRFTRGDDIWMSPSQGRDVAWIAVHTYQKEDHREYFERAEEYFLAAGARPHWGKLHGLRGPTLQALYPDWPAFDRVRRSLDPGNLFQNRYLRRLLGPDPAAVAAAAPCGPMPTPLVY